MTKKENIVVRNEQVLVTPESEGGEYRPVDFVGYGWYSLNDSTGWYEKGRLPTFSRIWICGKDATRVERLLGLRPCPL